MSAVLQGWTKLRKLISFFSSKYDNGKIDFSPSEKSIFHILLIKPTRYDDEGYPVQWYKSAVPANSLACLLGIAQDTASREILGKDVEIRVTAIDETNEVFNYSDLVKMIKNAGQNILVCLVGVQSNQFPRAIDIAKLFTTENLPVCIGGFHVSGCVSMLDKLPPELVDAQEMGVSLFAGEAEAMRFDIIVNDAWLGQLKPLYDFSSEMVDLENQPLPEMSKEMLANNLSLISTIDLGRGCPFQCSFCCIINVQGRKSRTRTPDDLEQLVRTAYAHGNRDIFITDDDFARNKEWESHFDRLIKLRNEGLEISIVIQVDALCHKIPGFIEKAVQAGVVHVFIGLENINPDNLAAMNKRQNKISEYRKMLLKWKKHPVIIWGAYIIGMPNDTRESILRDVDIIKRELPIDLFNPAILTPLPGSEDHKKMLTDGVWMDPDFNKYDLTHRVTHHPLMDDEELDRVYAEAWDSYYTFDHMATVFKRMFALGSDKKLTTLERLIAFGIVTKVNKIRSYDMGLIRRKYRQDRRDGYPIEAFMLFHAKHIFGTIKGLGIIVYSYRKMYRVMRSILNDPKKGEYEDIAITPVDDDVLNELELFNSTRGGKHEAHKVEMRNILNKKKAELAQSINAS